MGEEFPAFKKELKLQMHIHLSFSCVVLTKTIVFIPAWYLQKPLFSDIDECAAETNPCGVDAVCTNTLGSYQCSCSGGFEAVNGVCVGK